MINGVMSALKLRRMMAAEGVEETLPVVKHAVWAWMEKMVNTHAGAAVVDVLTVSEDVHTWLAVVAEDKPFLTDTVSVAVRESGLEIQGLWHPVVAVERSKGVLQAAKLATGGARKDKEAWILVCVERMDAAAARALVGRVQDGLKLATAAVRDFGAMQQQLQGIADSFAKGEERDFIRWVMDGNMIVLGYRHYNYKAGKSGLVVQATADSGLGILEDNAASSVVQAKSVDEVGGSLGLYVGGGTRLVLSKTPDNSRVHRAVPMDYVAVLERDTKGQVVGEHRFLGLYTSSAYTQGVRDIPLVRAKLAAVAKVVDWPKGSHNARSLQNVLETWPRDELFLSDVETLARLTKAAVHVREQPDVCVLVRLSAAEQAASALVYLPLNHMSTQVREKIGALLARRMGSKIREFKVEMGGVGGEHDLARLMFRLPWDGKTQVDEAQLTRDVRELVRGWDDELHEALSARFGAVEGTMLARNLLRVVGEDFKGRTSVDVAAEDVALLRGMKDLAIRLDVRDGLRVRMFRRDGAWALAELMPLVDSCGLSALSEQTFQLGDVWLHEIICYLPAGGISHAQQAALVAVMEAALRGENEIDSLNRLALTVGLGVRELNVWRAWVAYVQQIDRRLDSRTVRHVVRARPELAFKLWQIFAAQHGPALSERKRAQLVQPLVDEMEKAMADMPTAEQERVWRTLLGVVLAILRTNVFQLEDVAEAFAFKLQCDMVPGLPTPKPWREMMVYHPTVEGVHLRGGPVARGGLRHSDRATDYRTEVLGLMVAQMRKNTIIVPVGAKGGFYVKQKLPSDRAAAGAVVKACYQRYIRALLSVTDTYGAKGEVVHPRMVVRKDGNDPYLVVAADKGTAKFSDVANGEAIAADYWDGVTGGFWLGDAFASGGSKGYDHKEMAITARGAWVSVEHHLAALELTPTKARPVTMVGIGDMAGDVFGNGLLRSPYVHLVGAFNHAHIFLDPTPDAAASFAERTRMFEAALGWDGYDVKKISKGGGVWPRMVKSIPLSADMQARLGVKVKEASPDALISMLLRAPVDVLWNGGIGTYIKASDEAHVAVMDKANDDVRVDATQVKCKVIGEGGNLGITPRGRVELALCGVRLNTDALDNSAGVDTSDHEVNVKILLQLALRGGKLDEAGRVKVLRSMTDEMAKLVLADNHLQNLAISMDGAADAGYQRELLEWQEMLLEKGFLDAGVDILPTPKELMERKVVAYTRPELCALLAGTKAWLRTELLKDSELLQCAVVKPLLVGYFPQHIQSQFGALIEKHPLAKEIAGTALANLLVNRLGLLAIVRLMGDFDASAADAARALTVALGVAQMVPMWQQADAAPLPYAALVAVHERLKLVASVLAAWVLRHGQPVDVNGWLEKLGKPCAEIVEILPRALNGRPEMAAWAGEWQEMGVPAALAKRLSVLSPLVVAPDVVVMAQGLKKPLMEVLALHLRVGEVLKLPALVRKVRGMDVEDAWTRQAVQAMGQELFFRQRRLTEHLLKNGHKLDEWMTICGDGCRRYNLLVKDIMREKSLSVAMLSVLVGRLRELEG